MIAHERSLRDRAKARRDQMELYFRELLSNQRSQMAEIVFRELLMWRDLENRITGLDRFLISLCDGKFQEEFNDRS